MRPNDLPERWKVKLQDHLIAIGSKYKTLGSGDFPRDNVVRINFEDESKVEFRYAFIINAPELQEICVFTEHCGYHIFHSYDELNVVIEDPSDSLENY
ncbi:hypothetical protein GO988_00670 [Hymenobacter sp. HMF4947]|uniref:Uncharacterized protein n=1 Tax=Hymenobacter ginkgonis TaxID=2682976 RepID=A0A7K1T9K5_9BACT|nr:hypothetical protein [Hymenobacter ginkgonis]MVN74831.1 hypothetical protein [Hymenobacter ginkgonis]